MFRQLTHPILAVLVLAITGNVTADLVLHLPMEDAINPIDASPNPTTVIVHGALSLADGKFGTKGLEFNGDAANRLEVVSAPKLEGMSALTLEAWVIGRNIASYEGMSIVSKRNAFGDSDNFNLFIWTNQFVNARINGVGGNALISTTAIQDDTWYHIAFTFDGNNNTGEKVKLYINGVLEASGDHPDSSVGAGGAPVWIGELDANRGFAWDGIIDEIGIWNTALTQGQVNKLMTQSNKSDILNFSTDPNPSDGALYTATWVSLSWTAGVSAVSHDVYLSDNLADVEAGNTDAYVGNYSTNSLLAGFFGYPLPDGLIPGTNYYWRVDEVEADGSKNIGDVWSFLVPPRSAYAPIPADGGKFIDTEPTLSWQPGLDAKIHNVVFGDNFDDVNNAAAGSQVANTTFIPGTLEPDKTYYWRVDEFNPPTTTKGDVWSFTTAREGGGLKGEYFQGMNFNTLMVTRTDPQIDFDWGDPGGPDPSVGDDQFSARWTGEVEAAFTETYTFYTNSDDGVRLWVDGKRLVNNWTNHSNTENSGTIDLVAGETYSVVMEYYEDGGGAVAQLRWSSPRTPKQLIPAGAFNFLVSANRPKPVDGTYGVKLISDLTWEPGEFAASHEVYFGTDADAVANATKASPEYKGSKALGDETLDPGVLSFDTNYFWRVDEVNNANSDSPWVGKVWSFGTGDFLLVDDFESYDNVDPAPGEPGINRIFDRWIDGFGTLTNGALVGNDLPPYAEQNIVHGGEQSMNYRYDNAGKTSEATLTLIYPRDWTAEGVTKLSLWFRGDVANAADRIFVALNSTAVIYHDDASATQLSGWNEWVIDLSSFGINLTNINTITIGIGTKNVPSAGGGTGTIYFDDIRLYR